MSPRSRRPEPLPVGPGQESVWDYPRPPRVDPVAKRVVVRLGGTVIADTTDAVRVLETSHPPVYYLPVASFVDGALRPAAGTTFCEFKGEASYLDVIGGSAVAPSAGWYYAAPSRGFAELRNMVALYPGRMERCEVGGEVVEAQDGDFYGGWITSEIVGPFKGAPGTWGW
jgi:uncharacterized protein (DUF427 family)